MTETEAAERVCALLNEMQAAGYEVSTGGVGRDLWVGDVCLREPLLGDGEWDLYR